MSNLGDYQILTTFAKKVGGPKNLIGMTFLGGAAVGITGYKCLKRITNKIREKIKSSENETIDKDEAIYTIHKDGVTNEGIELKIGDIFRVLESDNDAILVEIIGRENNPYFISRELLFDISDYMTELSGDMNIENT